MCLYSKTYKIYSEVIANSQGPLEFVEKQPQLYRQPENPTIKEETNKKGPEFGN